MKLSLPICLGLVLLVFASSTLGDSGMLDIYYDDSDGNLPLGFPCTSPRTPFPDGTPICIYWDNNANGPGDDDQPTVGIGYSQVNFNCFSFNGTASAVGAGYFFIDPQFVVRDLPFSDATHLGDTALYYLQINAGGTCWWSPVFRVQPGSGEITFIDDSLICANHACSGGTVPNAPTNCNATDDTHCLSVQVSWQHNGTNVGGFNVYTGTDLVASAGQASRSATFDVYDDAVSPYHVKAYNGNGESAASNMDNGSGYLLRFVGGPEGNIAGANHHGLRDTLLLERPNAQCYSGYQLWLLVNNVRHTLLFRDSLSTLAIFQFPNDTTLNHCRVLLVDSSFRLPVVLTDTTDSVFHLGIPDAADIRTYLSPDRFELAQNFPNPFNPETDIMFSVPTQAVVRVQVYNIMGQLVRTLTNAPYSVGVHRIHWDGRSDAGTNVGAGVYLCRMEAPGFMQAKKMLLLK